MLPTKGDYLKVIGTAGAGAVAGIWAHNTHKNMLITVLAVAVAGSLGYWAGSAMDTATGY